MHCVSYFLVGTLQKQTNKQNTNELNFYCEALYSKTFCLLVLSEPKRTFIMMKL